MVSRSRMIVSTLIKAMIQRLDLACKPTYDYVPMNLQVSVSERVLVESLRRSRSSRLYTQGSCGFRVLGGSQDSSGFLGCIGFWKAFVCTSLRASRARALHAYGFCVPTTTFFWGLKGWPTSRRSGLRA